MIRILRQTAVLYDKLCTSGHSQKRAVTAGNRTEAVRARFCGIQANAACLSLQELDNSCALKTSDAKELAEEFRLLHRDFPLKIYGGCCGTDESHIREMIKVLQ